MDLFALPCSYDVLLTDKSMFRMCKDRKISIYGELYSYYESSYRNHITLKINHHFKSFNLKKSEYLPRKYDKGSQVSLICTVKNSSFTDCIFK